MARRTRVLALATVLAVAVTGMEAGSGAVASAAVGPNGRVAYSSWDDDGNYDIYVVDPATPETPPVQLTTDGQYNNNPDWSPDGTQDRLRRLGRSRRPAYPGDGHRPGDRRLHDHQRSVRRRPSTATATSSRRGRRTVTRIAFVSSRPNADGTENWSYELYVMDAAGEVGAARRRHPADDRPAARSSGRASTTRR